MSASIEATAIIRRNGRVTLPIELRRQMGITGGMTFTVTSDGKSIFLDVKNPDSGDANKQPSRRITVCAA
jgi:bifunctional DNA-binding transcriptional regulator/antitoxin component of YhaV-PrlF toxin-antitoxin module